MVKTRDVNFLTSLLTSFWIYIVCTAKGNVVSFNTKKLMTGLRHIVGKQVHASALSKILREARESKVFLNNVDYRSARHVYIMNNDDVKRFKNFLLFKIIENDPNIKMLFK